MAYTRHGHHIKGTVLDDRPIGLLVARCGGPHRCGDCARDATQVLNELPHQDETPPTTEERSQKVYYDRKTIQKLYEVLNGSEILEIEQTYHVIDAMQNAGIYVRLTKEA